MTAHSFYRGRRDRTTESALSMTLLLSSPWLMMSRDTWSSCLSLRMLFAASLISFTACAPCVSSLDCSLNGECSSGTCICDPGWSGPSCGNLTLTETDPTLGHAWSNGSWSWGGLPLQANDGTWHLFYSQFERGCGLYDWSTNSRIVHAVSPSPTGPFVDVDVVEPAFSHNAQAMRARDGTWVVWYIGCGQGEAVRDCGGSPADALPLAPRTSPPRPPSPPSGPPRGT